MTDWYQRPSIKMCSKHPAPPLDFRNRLRKWLRKPYRSTGSSECDCPSVEIKIPPSFDQFVTSVDFAVGNGVTPDDPPILVLGLEGSEMITADEYKRRTGKDWD